MISLAIKQYRGKIRLILTGPFVDPLQTSSGSVVVVRGYLAVPCEKESGDSNPNQELALICLVYQ